MNESAMPDRPSYRRCIDVIDVIVDELGLVETLRRPLTSPMSPTPVGELVSWEGDSLDELVYVGLNVPSIGLDSHMVFAFTPSDSVLPHFTLDSVSAGGQLAFHLDLIPRTDLAVNIEYMKTMYGPLTDIFEASRDIVGLERAHLSPMQLAVMSPWMLAHRATPAAFDATATQVDAYLRHWLGLVTSLDVVLHAVNTAECIARDIRHRSVLFNPNIDKVWAQMDRLLGEEQSVGVQNHLKSPKRIAQM
jgi:hypothetical protein